MTGRTSPGANGHRRLPDAPGQGKPRVKPRLVLCATSERVPVPLDVPPLDEARVSGATRRVLPLCAEQAGVFSEGLSARGLSLAIADSRR
jgi:hypothetical protein